VIMDRTVPEKTLSGHRRVLAPSPHPLHGRQRLKGGFYKLPLMNRNLILLALCQGLFLTNNVVFIAINGLVGLSLAPLGWMATLPVMGYVVGAGDFHQSGGEDPVPLRAAHLVPAGAGWWPCCPRCCALMRPGAATSGCCAPPRWWRATTAPTGSSTVSPRPSWRCRRFARRQFRW
jgi:hypothetical protein